MKNIIFIIFFFLSTSQLDAAALRNYASRNESSSISDKEKEQMFSGLMTACMRWEFSLFSLITSYPCWKQLFAQYQFSGDRITLLHVTIQFASIEFTEHLIKKLKYPLDIPMWNGYTPLHLAACMGDVKKFELLLSAGAALILYDMDGLTPYGVALQYKRKEIIQLYQDKQLLLEECSEIIPEKTEEQMRKIKKHLDSKEQREKKESKKETEEVGYPRFVCRDGQLCFDGFVKEIYTKDELDNRSLYDEIVAVDFLKKS